MTTLSKKITNRTATIGVVGLGYVGLPLAVGFGEIGFPIIGVDLNTEKIAQLTQGVSYIPDVASESLATLVEAGHFHAYSNFAPLTDADVIFICVPTPLDEQKGPDLTFIRRAAASIADHLRPAQMVILQSTTYPGTTTEVVLPLLEQSGLTVGQDFFLAFSPERIDPGHVGSSGYDVRNTPKVVGGVTPACAELASQLLATLTPHIHPVSSPAVAEMSKLLENTFRSVNIALVNELTLLCDRMSIDIWEVIEAAKTKPFGFMPFYPGPGVGGHCIPVDPYYLSWKARAFDFYAKFIELAAEVNSEMPYFTVEKIVQALNKVGKTISKASILVLGVAFKRDIDDARNSPAQRVIELLLEIGATVYYYDPYVTQFSVGGNVFLSPKISIERVSLTEETVSAADCVVIITGHGNVDYEWVASHSQLVFDAVNVTSHIHQEHNNILRLGAK